MLQVLNANEEVRKEYFNSYIDTYLIRDVAEVGGVTDSSKFMKPLKACAAFTAEQANYNTLADAAYISELTAKYWLRLPEVLWIVYLLRSYSNNELKRMVKTLKLFFCGTGLYGFLSIRLTHDTLMDGAASRHYFEKYVAIDLECNSFFPSRLI